MEKWVVLARGMPSHLLGGEADVEPLRPEDTDERLSPPSETARPHLFHLVGLTSILAQIQRTYYTLRATRLTADNLAMSVKKGRTAHEQLYAWRDQLPASLWFRPWQQARTQTQSQMLSIRSMLADVTIDSFDRRSELAIDEETYKA